MSLTERHKNAIIASAILFILGFILLVYSTSIQLPNQYQTFLGIPYATNGGYDLAVLAKISSMIMGVALIGCGGIAAIYLLYENSNSSIQKS
jgi:dipeptide/tripeptide permease